MIEKLWWKKYKPKDLDEIILLPRIRKMVQSGPGNMIFHGHWGLGKTALATILAKPHPSIKLDSSFDTSIEVLRGRVDDFCSKMSILDNKDDLKIVILDEIDRISPQYQDALKGFIQAYDNNVRFIATTNHIDQVNPGILSRLESINFNPQNSEEIKFLKVEYSKFLFNISKKENLDLKKENLVSIVNDNFPDMRKMVENLQRIKISGKIDINFKDGYKDQLYKLILNKRNKEVYDFLMENFGDAGIRDLIKLLGRPFIEYLANKDIKYVPYLGDISECVTKYSFMLKDVADPIILGYGMINRIQKILKI